MLGFSVGVDGKELAMISCKSLISQSCLSSTENGEDGDGFLNALAISLITQRAASVEKKSGQGRCVGII